MIVLTAYLCKNRWKSTRWLQNYACHRRMFANVRINGKVKLYFEGHSLVNERNPFRLRPSQVMHIAAWHNNLIQSRAKLGFFLIENNVFPISRLGSSTLRRPAKIAQRRYAWSHEGFQGNNLHTCKNAIIPTYRLTLEWGASLRELLDFSLMSATLNVEIFALLSAKKWQSFSILVPHKTYLAKGVIPRWRNPYDPGLVFEMKGTSLCLAFSFSWAT